MSSNSNKFNVEKYYKPSNCFNRKLSSEDGLSSTETLSAEDNHTIRHMQRQEPQGEEQVVTFSSANSRPLTNIKLRQTQLARDDDLPSSYSPLSTCRNNESNLSSSSSNTNTLIIHHSVPEESWSNRWLSGYNFSNSKQSRENSVPPSSNIGSMHNPLNDSIGSSSGTPISLLNSNMHSPYIGTSVANYMTHNSSVYMDNRPIPSKYSSTEIPDIPSSYLDQSEVLKHLIGSSKDSGRGLLASSYGGSTSASGAFSDQSASSSNSAINAIHTDRGSVSGSSSHGSQYISGLLDREDADLSLLLHRLDYPPPVYPWRMETSRPTKEPESHTDKSLLSKSQPDLTRVGALKEHSPTAKDYLGSRYLLGLAENEENPVFLKELVDILTRENGALKVDLDVCRRKVAKLRKFELEMTKVEEQYEALVKMCERREQLERLARHKLQAESRRLTDENSELRDRVEGMRHQGLLSDKGSDGNRLQAAANESTTSGASQMDAAKLKKDLNQRDVLIAQLVSQNKELVATKERQAMEITAQRQTLNEQRTHIDILDSALTSTQANIVKLEEEVQKKQGAIEQSGQMKRLLLSIKLAADKREQSEKNLRQKLEMEILQLKSNAKLDNSSMDVSNLRRDIREKEERIMGLEGEVTKWEQRFLQNSINTTPKSLNESTENAQADVARIQNLEGIQNLTKKIADLQIRNRTLEALNAEREMMIKNLQTQFEDKDSPTEPPPAKKVLVTSLRADDMGSAIKVTEPTSSNHSRSGSIGGSVHSLPPFAMTSSNSFPKKDEELGKLSSSCYPPSPTRVFPKSYFSADLPSPDGNMKSSGSYCCYVTSPESPEFGPHNGSGFPAPENPSVPINKGDLSPNACDKAYPFAPPSFLGLNSFQVPNNTPRPFSVSTQNPNYISRPSNSLSTSPTKNGTTLATSSHVQDFSRGNPPPYHSCHQVHYPRGSSEERSTPNLGAQNPHQTGQLVVSCSNQSQSACGQQYSSLPPPSPPLPRPTLTCQRPHPPNAFCRTCLNVRRSHRQNAAALVRRANSNSCAHNRRSAPSPASSGDSLDDAPSILEQLKKEWETGVLGSPGNRPRTRSTGNASGNERITVTKSFQRPRCDSPVPTERKEENNNLNSRSTDDNSPPSILSISSDSNAKKNVSELDSALNRLSVKRGEQQVQSKPPVKPSTDGTRASSIPPQDNEYPGVMRRKERNPHSLSLRLKRCNDDKTEVKSEGNQ